MAESALAGLRVLEIAQGIAGPYCGKMLAGLGAEVIKLEPPDGDWARRRLPMPDGDSGPESSGLFHYLNLGKYGIAGDITDTNIRDGVRELAGSVDVIVEDLPPGMLETLGLGYESLSANNPGLVLTRISAFGQSGPHRDYRLGELTAWAAAGYAYLAPASAESSAVPPLKLGGNQALFMAGLSAADGTMASLIWRERSGEGQEVDVSIQEAVIVGNEPIWAPWLAWHDIVPTRAVRGSFSYFPCKDGYLSLLFVRDDQWQRMVEFMGNPEWGQSDLFSTGFGRRQNWDVLFSMLSEWFMERTKAEIVEAAQAQRIPIAPVNTAEEVVNAPHLADRGYFIDARDGSPVGTAARQADMLVPGAPYVLSETPWQFVRPAPRLGEHTSRFLGGEQP
jgi:crotonobetainyl-CoA:carnitine CoA-transferase CaiB-like acyl-CoA transferase